MRRHVDLGAPHPSKDPIVHGGLPDIGIHLESAKAPWLP
jgi:hypothetical protein